MIVHLYVSVFTIIFYFLPPDLPAFSHSSPSMDDLMHHSTRPVGPSLRTRGPFTPFHYILWLELYGQVSLVAVTPLAGRMASRRLVQRPCDARHPLSIRKSWWRRFRAPGTWGGGGAPWSWAPPHATTRIGPWDLHQPHKTLSIPTSF